jgi:hypothetical protein
LWLLLLAGEGSLPTIIKLARKPEKVGVVGFCSVMVEASSYPGSYGPNSDGRKIRMLQSRTPPQDSCTLIYHLPALYNTKLKETRFCLHLCKLWTYAPYNARNRAVTKWRSFASVFAEIYKKTPFWRNELWNSEVHRSSASKEGHSSKHVPFVHLKTRRTLNLVTFQPYCFLCDSGSYWPNARGDSVLMY